MKRTLLVALVALAACASVPPNYANGPTAALGGLAVVDGIGVRPLAVIEDSRCPILVRCVWEGRVRIRAEISGAGAAQIRELTLGDPVAAGGGTLTLVEVQPPKRVPETIEPSAYRFTFRFER